MLCVVFTRLCLVLIIISLENVTASIRVGFLSDGSEDNTVLSDCLRNTSISLITVSACHNYNGLENVARLQYVHRVKALIGSPCADESATVSRLAYRWGIPFLSTSVDAWQDKEATTYAMAPNYQRGLAEALGLLLDGTKVKKTVLYSDDYSSTAMEAAKYIGEQINIINYQKIQSDKLELPNQVVVVIVNAETRVQLLNYLMSRRKSHLGTQFIIYSDGSTDAKTFYAKLTDLMSNASDVEQQLIMANFVLLQSSHASKNEELLWNQNTTVTKAVEGSMLLCDAISLLEQTGGSIEHLNHFQGREIEGLSGPIFLRSDGTRQPYFEVFTWEYDHMLHAASLRPSEIPCNESVSQPCISYVLNNVSNSSVLASLSSSRDECEGFACFTNILALLTVVFIFVAIGLPLLTTLRFQRKEKEMNRMSWRIAYENVMQRKRQEETNFPGYRKISSTSSAAISMAKLQCLGNSSVSYWNDQKVFVKSYKQKRALSFTRAEMKQLDELRALSHTNVNTFIGMSFNQNNEMTVLWKHCSRSSLEHAIFFNKQRFGRTFQGSFLKHIISGLQYIHNSPIQYHGALFLSNCVVDSYWVVKLTNFGLQNIIWDKMDFKEIAGSRAVDVDELPAKYYQLPPEVLRIIAQNGLLCSGSQIADIYQLGMIIYQILYHRRPFSEKFDRTPRELVEAICESSKNNPCYPEIPDENDYTTRLVSVMQQCWSSNEELRPEMYEISDAVAREFEKEGKGNIIDQMVRIIDDYQENLEQKIDERTKNLESLLDRTQKILFQILPRNIAEDLREGKQVSPVMHPCVSIMFGDICKFTELCESCIPVHVIDILQDLYSSFDQIVSKHNVFKVENVGDNYLLVSGLDGCNNHLEEICNMSLELVKFIDNHTTKHRPDIKLRMKVGINSGAVASGLLGSSAPRFCLFGDTLNMTCQMAATSEPGQIQTMEGTARIIQTRYDNKFNVKERGLVDVKGKGPITTYWVTGFE
ncbi:unnamed protein product [Cylicocyclus nassatus]|uniref:guanylate cyclase n=1 Tax=Cylicocyclus nassatus TaxID=53992 RepID=A0AA36H4W6_CYLNA|nr:unnamed protein product [Cylicocyclus nassatus]